MHRLAVVALCLCLLGQPVVGASQSAASVQETIDPDDVSITIGLEGDGDATWEIEYRKRLDSDAAEETFDDVAADIAANNSEYVQRFHNRMDETAADAADTTGREMTIEDVAVSAERRELPQQYGVVTYAFRWTNFAAREGDRIVAGDAVDGLFLDEQSALTVEWASGYELEEARPTPSSERTRAVVWEGPLDFTAGEPRVVLVEESGGDGEGPARSAVTVGSLLFAALVLAGGGAAVYRRRRGRDDPDTGVDTDLLSNEEQVLELLAANGGRLKQKEIADRLEWSDTKTSDVTKRLREEGSVEAFRLGRENVIRLPGEDDT